MERKICKGKHRLLDNDRNSLALTRIMESNSEVEVVFDETANLRISKSGKDGSDKGYGTNKLLEQWRDSYSSNDDYDPYDDDIDVELTHILYTESFFRVIHLPRKPFTQKRIEDNQLPVVISSSLFAHEKTNLFEILKNHKGAITWSIADNKRIDSSFCTHKILMEDEFNPTIQPQTRVNPNIKEVVKKEVVKLLDAGYFQILIALEDQEKNTFTGPYETFAYKRMPFGLYNAPATLQHCMMNIFYELIEDRIEPLGQPCSSSSKERWDDCYFQIPIALEDQEKNTFTGPYETFAYKRMPFGLYNAPATLQHCMMNIFYELIEDRMEVFTDD
nr:hypothetical protein [Tanacetum cinerariifolium]